MKERSKRLLSVLLSLVLLLGMVPGMTLDARADGDVAQIGSTGYKTLQDALDAATDGQTVQLIADVTENVTFKEDNDGAVTLDLNSHGISGTADGGSVLTVSKGTLTVTDNAPTTSHYYTIEDDTTPVMIVTDDATGAYGSFTGGYITGGKGTPDETYGENGVTKGGGIYVAGGAALHLNGGTVIGNRATYGGGIHVDDGACGFTIGKDAAIIGNQAAMNEDYGGDGGGVYVSNEGEYLVDGTDDKYAYYAFAIDGTISYNNAVKGGGVFTDQSECVITARIEGNSAKLGGGVYKDEGAPKQKGVIRNNSAEYGGGVYVAQGEALLDGTTITGNIASHDGGGVYMNNDTLIVITNSEITNNTAEFLGGGVYASSRSGVTPTGASKVTGNKSGAEVTDNVYLSSSSYIQSYQYYALENSEYVKKTIAPSPSASNAIGITLGTEDGSGKFTNINDETLAGNIIGSFFSDSTNYTVNRGDSSAQNQGDLFLIAKDIDLVGPVSIYKGSAKVGSNSKLEPGDTVSAVVGAGTYLTYTWYRADADGKPTGEPIGTGKTYVIQVSDIEEKLVVTAKKSTTTLTSDPTPPIQGLVLIHNLQELEQFRDYVNQGADYTNKKVRLAADIDMSSKYSESGAKWTAIGNSDHPFIGFFDGNGYTVSGLYANDSNAVYQGLFGYAMGETTIQNIKLAGAKVTGGTYTGGLVGKLEREDQYDVEEWIYNYPQIINCSVDAEVNGKQYVGGVVGYIKDGPIIGCKHSGSVTAEYTGSTYVGGIVGYIFEDGNNKGNPETGLSNCTNTGAVTAHVGQSETASGNTKYVGGIAGWVQNEDSSDPFVIENGYNEGAVSVTAGSVNAFIGGVIANLLGGFQMSHSSNTGAVTDGTNTAYQVIIGGIIGCVGNGTVANCYNAGNVTISSKKTDEYTSGNEHYNVINSSAGGVFGMTAWNTKPVFTNCHSYGQVNKSEGVQTDHVRGFGGSKGNLNYDYDYTANHCYYIVTSPSDDKGSALTADEFKATAKFVDWNFTAIWEMKATEPQYPVFQSFKLLESVDIKKGSTSLGTSEPQVNDVLTADVDDAMPVTFQWYRVKGDVEAEIEGETSATYTVKLADLGFLLRVKATQEQAGADPIVKSDDTVEISAAARNIGHEGTTKDIAYLTLQAAFNDSENLADGDTIVLLKDVTENVTFDWTNKAVTLDLNGKTISTKEEDCNYLIVVVSGSLTLEDRASGGKISNPVGGAVSVRNGAAFILKSGSLCDNHPTSNNCTVSVDQGGAFTMTGGAIENNISTATTGCGVYLNTQTTFIMTGGKIADNKGINCAGVYVAGNSAFTMTGGEITRNVAAGESASFSYGAGVCVQPNGSMVFGGTAKVTGNLLKIAGNADKPDNVELMGMSEDTRAKVAVSTNVPFATGAHVSITMRFADGKGVFTRDIADSAAQTAAKPYFFSDNDAYSVLFTVTADNAPNQLKLDVVTYAKLEKLSITNDTNEKRDGSGDESTYPLVRDQLHALATDNSSTTATPVTYQWYRADSKDGPYTAIPDATDASYTAAAADAGKFLKVVATQDKNEALETLSTPIEMEAVIGPVALLDAPEPFVETHPAYPTSNDGQITKTHADADILEYANLYYSGNNGSTWTKVSTEGKTTDNLPAGTYLFSYRVSDGQGGTIAESKTTTVILTPENDLIWLKLSKVSPADKMANEVGATIQAETNFGGTIPENTTLTYKWYRIKENADGTIERADLTAVAGHPDQYTIAAEDAGCKVLAEVTWTYDGEQTKTLSTPTPIIVDTAPELRGVSGKVTRNNAGVSGATVELRQGNTVIATVKTDGEGNYQFEGSNRVPDGEYNIVVTTNTNPAVTKTDTVTVSGGDNSKDIALPSSDISSTVVVQGNIPAITVSSLDGVAEELTVEDNQAVEIKLTVEGKEDLTVKDETELTPAQITEKKDQEKVKLEAKSKIGENAVVDFLDMGIIKTTKESNLSTTEAIRDTGANVLSVRIPYLTQGRYQWGIYRKHVDDSNKETILNFTDITNSGAIADGTFKVGDGYLLVFASKFSTYAIGYTTTPPTTPVRNTGGGGGGAYTYPVTVDNSTGGTVKADKTRAASGAKVTLTVTPNDGYRTGAVTVTDKNGKSVSVTQNADGSYSFTMPASAVTVNVSFAEAEQHQTNRPAAPTETGVADWLITETHPVYLSGYEDGTIRPQGNITRAETAVMFYRLLKNKEAAVRESYTDVAEDAWYAEAVGVLSGLGVLKGYEDGSFRPGSAITRAEFAAIATRFAVAAGGRAEFSDVPNGHWAETSIATASDYGWIGGYGDGTYLPANPITRAEAATIVNRMTGRAADEAFVLANREKLVQFTDLQDTGAWYYFELAEASTAHNFTRTGVAEQWKETSENI